jgi:aminoglycoside phosphotransferase family enzyme/predicted kinase
MDTSQAEVFAFLGAPASYGAKEVRRFDTHAAAVFLAGDRAFKVKKAVRFPFLDYSTLEKREAACRAELDINRRFAPMLYLGVVPITRAANGRMAIGGDGEVLEWTVEMQRFDENKTLDRVADGGALGDPMSEKLAGMVRAMHEKAERVRAEPWIRAVELYIGQNTEAFRAWPAVFPEASVVDLEAKSRAALRRLRPLLIERGRHGFVRRGHGDLHLGNIAVLQDEPVAFDAIEFDPVIASGDVLYDFAFLLMDLINRDDVAAANSVLNVYMDSAGGSATAIGGLTALPFFMSLRAAIRAKVTAARFDQAEEEASALRASATHYFDLALRLLEPVVPVIICIGGLSGTGKSVLAKQLAKFIPPLPGALVLRSDVLRKRMFGVAETDRLSPVAYQTEISTRVYEDIAAKVASISSAGYSVVVDAVFANADARDAVEKAARRAGVAFFGVFLVADLGTRMRRIDHRGPDASDADAQVARKQEAYDLGAMTWTKVDASGSPIDTLERVRAALARSRDQHGRALKPAGP